MGGSRSEQTPAPGWRMEVPPPGSVDPRFGHAGVLLNAAADKAVAVRFNRNELPCLTVWKNCATAEDGYVTGLEPATGYPNFKTFERKQGRVRTLPPGGRWECRWSVEAAEGAPAVAGLLAEVARLQAQGKALIHRTPQPKFSPAAGQA